MNDLPCPVGYSKSSVNHTKSNYNRLMKNQAFQTTCTPRPNYMYNTAYAYPVTQRNRKDNRSNKLSSGKEVSNARHEILQATYLTC